MDNHTVITAHAIKSAHDYTDHRISDMEAEIQTLRHEIHEEHNRRIVVKLWIHIPGLAIGGLLGALLTIAGMYPAAVVIIAGIPNLAIEVFDAKWRI